MHFSEVGLPIHCLLLTTINTVPQKKFTLLFLLYSDYLIHMWKCEMWMWKLSRVSFVPYFLCYVSANDYLNWFTVAKGVTGIKRVNYLLRHSVVSECFLLVVLSLVVGMTAIDCLQRLLSKQWPTRLPSNLRHDHLWMLVHLVTSS